MATCPTSPSSRLGPPRPGDLGVGLSARAHMLRFGVVLALLAGLAASAWWLWTDRKRPRGLHWLHGPLARVEVQFDCWGLAVPATSAWRSKWVGTDDPAFLARVERWLDTVQRPPCCNALRQRGGRIVLTYHSGRREEILFRGADRPGPASAGCYGFLWEGLDLVGGEEPFSTFLADLRTE